MVNRQLNGTHVVTGAFGFTGKYIARLLLQKGRRVVTLTGSVKRSNPFNGAVKAYPYSFDDPEKLVEVLRGAEVLYNNYWVRFNHRNFSYAKAVENTIRLFDAAVKAGVGRIVHISITNPSENSEFEYFRGKAVLERRLVESGLSYAILRPAVIFGREDILINNIAWFLRRFPVFGVFGDGGYRLQPVYVEDLAELAVQKAQSTENMVIDAVGPETYTYRELVEEIGNSLGKPRPVVSIPPLLGYALGFAAGKCLGDVTITRDEIEGLMAGLLYTGSPPTGKTRLSEWMRDNSATLGARYSNELGRRNNRTVSYQEL